MFDLLNRPALLLTTCVAAALVGFLAGRARGALAALLLAGAGIGLLVAAKAAEFGLPDAGGYFLAGLAGAAVALALAWRVLRPPRA